MSLKFFHIVFILLSILLAFAFGVWALQKPGYLSLAVISLVLGLMLVIYLIYFYRKMRLQKL